MKIPPLKRLSTEFHCPAATQTHPAETCLVTLSMKQILSTLDDSSERNFLELEGVLRGVDVPLDVFQGTGTTELLLQELSPHFTFCVACIAVFHGKHSIMHCSILR